MICHRCGATRDTKTDRVPVGWKRHRGEIWCKDCWRSAYILRAITVPISGPVDRDWKELRQCLAACWADSTALANWAVTELAKADIVRTAADTKLPAMASVYLYPDARRRCPNLNPQSVVALLQSVDRRYRKRRLEAIWRSSESLPRYRYPVPYPVHNQGWHLEQRDDRYILCTRMQGESWELRLRGGPGFWRQQQALDAIISGEGVRGELSIYRVRAHGGDHRNGVSGRTDGETAQYRIMAKMVAWLPRVERAHKNGLVMSLHTGGYHFWKATTTADHDPWYLNADHVRTWIIGYERFRQRAAEDRKPEMSRRYAQREQDQRGHKHHNRIKSFMQMSIAALAGYARRIGVSRVIYHDSDRGYLLSFPWAELRTALGIKLDEYGIAFEDASGEVAKESSDPLAEEKDE